MMSSILHSSSSDATPAISCAGHRRPLPLRFGRGAAGAAALALLYAGCVAADKPFAGLDDGLHLPEQEAWVDCGPILTSGGAGDWDLLLWGGFASSVVRRAGIFHLYYQGSDGYHEAEATVMHRAIGLATSTDGLHFTRHPDNPVITFSDSGNHEEGAVSSAPLVASDGTVAMYYGANSWIGGDAVSANARLATSADGVEFTDRGVVLAFDDRRVWGHGDEIFPVAALEHGTGHVVFYIPNGTAQGGQLGVAWGAGSLSRTAPAREGRRSVSAWGAGSIVAMQGDMHILFLTGGRGAPFMEARAFSAADPSRLSPPLRRYQWDDRDPRAIIPLEESGIWLLYYRDADHASYGVMAAPARHDASLPPRCSAPPSLSHP
jgi:hypothetical protein